MALHSSEEVQGRRDLKHFRTSELEVYLQSEVLTVSEANGGNAKSKDAALQEDARDPRGCLATRSPTGWTTIG